MLINYLESRLLFAAPTESETLMMDLINRARQNPIAELARFNMDINEGLPQNTISPQPKSKLKWNSQLNDIAKKHAEYLMQNGLMTHVSANGDGMFERVTKSGIQAQYVDENAGVLMSSYAYGNLKYAAERLHDCFVTDTSLPRKGT